MAVTCGVDGYSLLACGSELESGRCLRWKLSGSRGCAECS